MLAFTLMIATSLIASFYLKQGLAYKVIKNWRRLSEWDDNEFFACLGIIVISFLTVFTGSYLSMML
jgi:hypothetical protein